MLRREFITRFSGGVLGLSFIAGCRKAYGPSKPTPLRFGLVTDSHYADRKPGGSRYYRHSLDKLHGCMTYYNNQNLDFVIELGDFKDQDTPPDEAATIKYLQAVEKSFQQFNGPTYHVLGNHDVDSISKSQFLANIENTDIPKDQTYYSFDIKGVHCVVLDANFKTDGTDYDHGNFNWTDANIPAAQLDWLKNDLAKARGTVLVFLHQLLDGKGAHYVNNAAEVRKVLEGSQKVAAVFQGHQHKGGYKQINGIHYHTAKAMCEGPFPGNNAYATVEVNSNAIIVNACKQPPVNYKLSATTDR